MNDFVMAYQTINSIDGVFGYEALVRGNDSKRIIQLFQESDYNHRELIRKIDSNLKHYAIMQSPVLLGQKLFINTHPFSHDILNWAYDECEHIKAEQIVVEITEYAQVDKLFVKRVHQLKEKGIEFAIDDLGSGYFDANLILEIKPTYIKIAKEVTAHVHEDSEKLKMVGVLSELCNRFGAKIILEGIEGALQFESLRLFSSLFQGYYFSKPTVFKSINRISNLSSIQNRKTPAI